MAPKNNNAMIIGCLLLYCGCLSFAQGTFSLDSNGVTVKCTGCVAGNTGTVGGVTYTAVDNSTIGSTADGDWDTSSDFSCYRHVRFIFKSSHI